jgi:hypothetical protein
VVLPLGKPRLQLLPVLARELKELVSVLAVSAPVLGVVARTLMSLRLEFVIN